MVASKSFFTNSAVVCSCQSFSNSCGVIIGGSTMTPQELEKLWQEHTTAEFVKKDLEATMATMTDDAYINIVPLNINARGKDMVLAFYRDILIQSVPDDLQATIVNL